MKKEYNNSEEKVIVNLSFVTCLPTLPVSPWGSRGYFFHSDLEKYIVHESTSILKSAIVDVQCKLRVKLRGPSVEMSFLISMVMIKSQGSRHLHIALNL